MSDPARGQVVDAAAEVYEQFFVPALFAQWAEPMLTAAGIGSGDRVLDVGCGTGVLACAAARTVGPAGRVVGLDRNSPMLAVARRAPEVVDWRQGDAEDLPFDDHAVDRVVCQFALMFFDDRRRAVDEMLRVLRPGGTLAVATWCAVDESPGYAAMVDVVRRVVGESAATALLAPFTLGTVEVVTELLDTGRARDVHVTRRTGTARFASIESWVHTDIRGWTLAGSIDDATYDRLLDEARVVLAPFTDPSGRVRFAAPALIGTAAS